MAGGVLDGCRDEDLAGAGDIGQAAGEVDRRAEQIVVVVDRLACGHPDPDAVRRLPAGRDPLSEPRLDLERAGERSANVVEGSHDSVTGVLHLPATRPEERSADDAIVRLQEVEVARRLQAFGEGRRVFEVREEDRPKRRRHLGLVGGIFDLSEEAQDCILRGVDDLGRNEAVRLGVGFRHVLRGRSACEAEGRSQVWIEPVGEKGHVVLAGDLQVLGMGARHVLGSHPGKVVSVEVERHRGRT